MTLKLLKEELNKVRKALDVFNIVEAISLLKKIAEDLRSRKILDKLNELLENYEYMISFMLTGGKDDSRFVQRENLIEHLRMISDRLERDAIAIEADDIYSETLRNLRISPLGFQDVLAQYISAESELSLARLAEGENVQLKKKLEELQSQLFNRVWTSLDNPRICAAIREMAVAEKENNGNEDLSIHLINAMILSLLFYYDRNKVETLLDIYLEASSQRIKARALSGIVLIAPSYPHRLSQSGILTKKLTLLYDDLMAYRNLREILMAILRTRDTDRVSRKMTSEVIPELMKLQPDFIKKMRGGENDMIPNALDDNPEWEEMLEKTGLGEKLRELNEMQNSGADLMMVTFANLKQFPFFNRASNWFLPFDSSHSALPEDKKQREILEQLMSLSSSTCDSDKFSLGIALGKMPDSQREMMTSQLDAQFAQMKEEINDQRLKSSYPEFDEELTKTIRDFYRFFKLFRKKNGFKDPFESTFKFDTIPVIGEILSDGEIIRVVAEFYFKRGFYSEALDLFQTLISADAEDASLWEKIGFCYQAMKFYDNAADAYSKAELLHLPGMWLLNKMSYVYGKIGDYQKSLEICERILEKEPENRDILVRAGYSAMQCKDYDKALSYYYHADYIESDSPSLLRAIIWCEFLKGDYSKCERLFSKLPDEDRNASDHIIMGHIAMIQEKYEEAVKKYLQAGAESFSEFEKSFYEDLPVLEKAGVDRRNAQIILDKVRLSRQGID